MSDLLTFRQYADHAAINVSSVSRAVERGYIPTVKVDGKRLIDPVAADAARKLRERSHGPGGTPERRERQQAKWRARVGHGFDHGQHLLLGALTEHGPRLMADGMRMAGATDEDDIARAAAAMHEIVELAAALLFEDFNQAGVISYREILPLTFTPRLSPEAADLYERLAYPEQDESLDPDAPSPFEDLFDLADPVFSAASLAK